MIEQIDGMLSAIGVGYLGAGCWLVLVVTAFYLAVKADEWRGRK